jgi:NAD(P)-dependent dehydrogenase (short-subunit alcohol dehydrogenase family)
MSGCSVAGEGKTAVVTGASGGVGGACAHALLEAGWSVVLTGRDARKLERAIQSAGTNSDRALHIACDITREEEVDHLFAEVKSRFGRLDLLFNNAGTFGTPELPD